MQNLQNNKTNELYNIMNIVEVRQCHRIDEGKFL